MRVLGNLPIDKKLAAKYPFGATVQNETDLVSGTPVIEEVYGDILMNLYKLLSLANITPTNAEDSSDTQFQLVEALKKLPNSLNDIEQVLTLNGDVWSVPFDLSILPNKYVFLCRPTDNYVAGGDYTFKGTGILELPFFSDGFQASSEVLVVIDNSTVRAYSLSVLTQTPNSFVNISTKAVKQNSTTNQYYYDDDNGFLHDNNLLSVNLQNSIRVDQSDGALVLRNCFVLQGHVLCVVFNPTTENYEFYAFSLLDLSTVIPLTNDLAQTPTQNFNPEFYADNNNLYATNDGNTSASDDFRVVTMELNVGAGTINKIAAVDLDASFVKDANGAVNSGFLYVFQGGFLDKFSLSTGVKTAIGQYPTITGELLTFNGELYIQTGEISHKITI